MKNTEILQDAAIVRLKDTDAFINTSAESSDMKKVIRVLLDVRKKYDSQKLTEKVRAAYLNTVRKNRTLLPGDYIINAADFFYDTVQAQETFIIEHFLSTIFHTYYIPKIKRDFEEELKNKEILGVSFVFHKQLQPPKRRKYRTEEGVVIQFPAKAEDTVAIQHLSNKKIVTIITHKLHEEHTGN